MSLNIFFILTVALFSQGITLLIVQSAFRKKETIVLYGMRFIINSLLSAILIYAIPYKITVLECLRGFALFFTFFFLFIAWNSIVVPARKWLQFSKKHLIAGLLVGVFHAVVILLYSSDERSALMDNLHNNIFSSHFLMAKISVAMIIIVTSYFIFVCIKRMVKVNMLFLDYIMNNYSYIEEALIRYKNVIIASVLFLLASFAVDLMMILYYNLWVIIVYSIYQLLYTYIILYIVFNFNTYTKTESLITIYYTNFLADTNIKEFNLFFSSKPEVLIEDKQEDLSKRLIMYFEQSKPYLSKRLIMNDVARELNTNRTYISKVINTDFNTTFFNFVNVFRIEEAKKQIEATPSYSMKAIADNCGFSSYTTFAKYYKMYHNKSADWWYEKRETLSK